MFSFFARQSKSHRLEGAVEEQRERIRCLENQAERSRFMAKKLEASVDAKSHQINYLKRMVTHLNPSSQDVSLDDQRSIQSPLDQQQNSFQNADQGFINLFLKYSAVCDQLERIKNERALLPNANETTAAASSEAPDPFTPPANCGLKGQNSSASSLMISTCLKEMRLGIDTLQKNPGSAQQNEQTVNELSSNLARLSSVVSEQSEAFETIQQWCDTVRRRQKNLEDSYQTRLGLLLERLTEQQQQQQQLQQLPPTPPTHRHGSVPSHLCMENAANRQKCSGEVAKLISWLQLLVLKEVKEDPTSLQMQQQNGHDEHGGDEASLSKTERQRLLWQANRSLQLTLPLLNSQNEADFRDFLANFVVLLEGCGLLPAEAAATCSNDSTAKSHSNAASELLDLDNIIKKRYPPPCQDLQSG